MRRIFSAASALAIALALPVTAASLSLPKLGFGKDAPAPAAAQLLKPGEWAQAHSDVAPDPSIRFGALPNGMRYAIRKQAIPPGQAAVRGEITWRETWSFRRMTSPDGFSTSSITRGRLPNAVSIR